MDEDVKIYNYFIEIGTKYCKCNNWLIKLIIIGIASRLKNWFTIYYTMQAC